MPATKLAFSSRPTPSSWTPSFLVGPEAEALEQAVYRKISDRAYSLFEQSGRQPGNEDANWLQAEAEVLRSDVEVRESGTWVAVSAFIPDGSGQDMQIVVKPVRVLARARKFGKDRGSTETAKENEQEIILAANLPVEVDPLSAAASFRDHNLHLMIRKSRPDKIIGD
jgi:HSP20 family molecular chaperone IbpA